MNRYASVIGFGVLFLIWAYFYTALVGFLMKAAFFSTVAGAITVLILIRKGKRKRKQPELNTALKGAMLCRMEQTRRFPARKGKTWKN